MLQVEKGAGRGLAQMESRKVQTLNNRRGLVKRKHAQVISMPPTDPRYTYPTHVLVTCTLWYPRVCLLMVNLDKQIVAEK